MPLTFDLVIFDCDGVLVDSEPIANRVLMEGLAEVGLPLSYDETMQTFVGRSTVDCLAIIEQRIGRSLPGTFVTAWEKRLYSAFERGLEPIAGIHEALGRIDLPVCVASSGSTEKMRVSLGKTGLLERFQGRMFSGIDAPRPKPFPDLFLHAARSMAADAPRCVVVEDTKIGVVAGIAAGMTVFAYAAGAHSDARQFEEAGADVFFDMAELPDRLRSAARVAR